MVDTKEFRNLPTRDRIMSAAQSLFASKGLKETTTREIAHAAKVAEGSIYRHFSNKEDLAWQIFQTYHIQLADRIQMSADQCGDLEGRIKAMVKAFFRQADDNWSAFSFYLSGQQYYAARMDAESIHPYQVIKNVLSAAQQSGEIECANIDLVASMAMGCVHQIALNKQYGRIKGSLSKYKEEVSAAISRLVCTK